VTDLVKVQTVWSGVAGGPYYSTHYFFDSGTLAGANDCVDDMDTFWTAISGNLVNTLSYVVGADTVVIDDATGNLVGSYATTPESGAGASGTEQIPRASQGLLRWETGEIINSRRFRGRTFIPGYVEAANTTGGVPLPASMASLATAGAALIASSNSELRIYSRTHNVSHPAIACVADTEWAYLSTRRD